MKELKFTTSRGEFLLLDGKDTITERLAELLKEYKHHAVVKEMKDADFAEIVESYYRTDGSLVYVPYLSRFKSLAEGDNFTARDSFSSLILSLGWYLWENPVKMPFHPIVDSIMEEGIHVNYRKQKIDWQEAESKTLYSPILLKKI